MRGAALLPDQNGIDCCCKEELRRMFVLLRSAAVAVSAAHGIVRKKR